MKKKKGYYYIATVLLFVVCMIAGAGIAVALNLDRVGNRGGAGFALCFAIVLFAIPYRLVKKWLKPEEKKDDTTDTGSDKEPEK